jgi:hypothetical protein
MTEFKASIPAAAQAADRAGEVCEFVTRNNEYVWNFPPGKHFVRRVANDGNGKVEQFTVPVTVAEAAPLETHANEREGCAMDSAFEDCTFVESPEARIKKLKNLLRIARGALADIGYSEDLNLHMIRTKAKRIYLETARETGEATQNGQ